MTNAAAGWYPDQQGMLRYWDGLAWTEHTAPPMAQHPTAIVVRESPRPFAASAMPHPQSYTAPGYLVPAQSASVMPIYASAPVASLPNGVGVAGFVVGLVSVFLPLIFGIIGGVVGLVLSIVGLSRPNRVRGLAIAGLILSIFALVLIF